MKVALVYDRVNKIGGAERILVALHELFPEAPLFTLVYDEERAPWAKNFKVIPSFLQRIPLAKTYHEFFPIVPIFAFEQFNFSEYDVVISLTATEAKGIITSPNTLHICYLLTPTRYLWSHYDEYFSNPLVKIISLPFVSALRVWDQIASKRPDILIAISKTVAHRAKKYYGRDTQVIYPSVDTEKYKIQSIHRPSSNSKFKMKEKDYYLVVSRLVKYKRIEVVIEACNRLMQPLKIVGEGFEMNSLRKIAGPTVEFLGNLTDEELSAYYRNCRGLIMPQEEDFGISCVEALAAGKPVIAYKAGGATEIIAEGKTGEFFYPQTSEALAVVLEKFAKNTYSQALCQDAAKPFATATFKQNFKNMVKAELNIYRKKV